MIKMSHDGKNYHQFCTVHGLKQLIQTPTRVTFNLNGALSGLRQFLATESPLKMMKNTF